MTTFNYQATSLRSLVKQMLPSAESKNISESNWCSMTTEKHEVLCADGSVQMQHRLYAETEQPTFTLGVSMVLSTDEVQTDDVALTLVTKDLDMALATFKQDMVTVEMRKDGMLMLRSSNGVTDASAQTDDAMAQLKTLQVGAQVLDAFVPPVFVNGEYELSSMLPLLDGLRSTVDIASTRGNGLDMMGVRLIMAPDGMRVESASPSITARIQYDNLWSRAPQRSREYVLSTDAVRHLISALNAFGTSAPVRFEDHNGKLVLQTEGVYFEG